MTDILDIRNPVIWDLRWVWILLVSLLLFLLLYLAYRWWQRRKERRKMVPPLTPLEKGIGRLEEMIQQKWIEEGRIREFYFALSEIFRDFLEAELGVVTKEATLEELKPRLKAVSELIAQEVNEAMQLLQVADLAKFAKLIPTKEKVFHSYRVCRAWMTKIAERRRQLAEQALQLQKVSG